VLKKKNRFEKYLDVNESVLSQVDQFEKDIEDEIKIKGSISNLDNVLNIKIDSIKSPEFHDRQNYDQNKIKDLAESIKANGLLQPIIVTNNDDGTYTRVSGFRRIEAHKLLNIDTIMALVVKVENKSKMAQMMLTENISREALNQYDEIVAILEVIAYNLKSDVNYAKSLVYKIVNYNEGNIKNLDIVELQHKKILEDTLNNLGGLKPIHIKQKLTIFNYNPIILKAMLEDKIINQSQATELHKLRDNFEALEEALKLITNGTLKTVKQLKDFVKSKKSSNQTKTKVTSFFKSKIGEAFKDKGIFKITIKEKELTHTQLKELENLLNSFR